MIESLNPVVSVIVPVYKVEKYLDRCVQSILNQTMKDFELILIDDGSPDKCGMICDNWKNKDARIKVIHKENGGLSSARNAGLSIAKGDYIAFIDSDDWVSVDYLEYLYYLIEKYKVDYVECVLYPIHHYEMKKFNEKEVLKFLNRDELLKVYFRISQPEIHYFACGKLISMKTLQDIKFTVGTLFEDIDFNYRLNVKCKKVILSNQKKYYYFFNPTGISNRAFIVRDLELLQIWDKIIELTEQETPELLYYANFNRMRADLGILCKILKYGVANDVKNEKVLIKELVNKCKKNFFHLITGKLPTSRKIILIFICLNFKLLKFIFYIHQRCVNKFIER